MSQPIDESTLLAREAAAGDQRAFEQLFARHREQLKRMIQLRLDRRIQGRVDASDILQDAYADVARRISSYVERPGASFYVWLRQIAGERLIDTHRRHLGAKMRSVNNELSLARGALPDASSAFLAEHLLGRVTSVSRQVERAEIRVQVQEALNSMEKLDREILAMRHFELLSNAECAEALGISKNAASNRYMRALQRMRKLMAAMPVFKDDLRFKGN